jgi:hypothetical protein
VPMWFSHWTSLRTTEIGWNWENVEKPWTCVHREMAVPE